MGKKLGNMLEEELWEVVCEGEEEERKDNSWVDYFDILELNKDGNELYMKDKEEGGEYGKMDKGNYWKAMNMNKV